MNVGPASSDNQAIRELRDELKDLSQNIKKSTKVSERFTILLAIVAVFQLTVAVFQFAGFEHQWDGLILAIYTLAMMAVAVYIAIRGSKKSED